MQEKGVKRQVQDGDRQRMGGTYELPALIR